MQGKIKLLVVDDEERFLQTLTRRLSMRDFEVTPASSGQQALALANAHPFDLALLDLKMPGMSGEALLVALKEHDPLIEVVILTGHGSVDSAVECTRSGSYKYLQKPAETEELMRVLKDAYQRRVQRRLEADEERMEELLQMVQGDSPLAILRRLRELDRDGGG